MCDEDAVRKDNIENLDNYILDGGALLHRVRWFKGMKFNAVSAVSANCIWKNYRGCVTVVFDGYQDENTKSHAHLRGNFIPQSCNVDIHKENPVPFMQDHFLSNTENKANLINFLSQQFDTIRVFDYQLPWWCRQHHCENRSLKWEIQVGDMLPLWLMTRCRSDACSPLAKQHVWRLLLSREME